MDCNVGSLPDASAKAMEESVEVSMRVNGDVTAEPAGKIVGYAIQEEKALRLSRPLSAAGASHICPRP